MFTNMSKHILLLNKSNFKLFCYKIIAISSVFECKFNNAKLINSLSAAGKSISSLQKPDKIFLENTNLSFTLSPNNTDKGSLREAFFMNQLKNAVHEISLPLKGDFYIDDKYNLKL